MSKTITVTAYPFATVYGTIDVPDGVEDVETYVSDHWDSIEFGNIDLDYCMCDYEIN